jgi:hypothetical protein
MIDSGELTARLEARMAYLGIRTQIPTVDLLPTRSMPFGLTLPDCRDVAAFLVRLVRATYSRCRRNHRADAGQHPDRYGDHILARWDGGYDWSGRYHAPVWARIAAAVLERGFDMGDYVERSFARAAGVAAPYPNKLLSPAALDLYEQTRMPDLLHEREVNRGVTEDQFVSEVSRERWFYGQTQLGAAGLSVLRSQANSLSPFYRYWAAAQLDPEKPEHQQILLTNRRPALRQYASSVRAYDLVYDHPVLAEFRWVIGVAKSAFAALTADDQADWVPAPPAPGPGAAGSRP